MAPVHSVLALWPGAVVSTLQAQVPGDSIVRVWDSVTGRFVDSVVVHSPLPDPLVPIVQWIFQKPGWVMVGGIILAVIVAAAVLFLLWRHRQAIGTWLVTRDRVQKMAMVGGVAVVLLLIFGTGLKAYDYMMHDNDFCRGCHIFVPSGQIFVQPDTGTYLLVNKPEGKHDTLSCHSCHPFNLASQTKELIAWMTNRPDIIPEHGKVPQHICEQCHVTGPAKDTWKRITSTAGHKTHLESDSSALKDVECLTCHARTAHRFQPVDTTCAQQGCHFSDSIRIRLGRMATRFASSKPLPNEEQLYCNSCHQFTVDAQFLAPDSVVGLLRPASRQCFSCHEMRVLFANYDPAREPHSGSCGMCHNPHTDVKPADALKSCADAQCHANWRDVDFHTGAAHRKVAQRCETCHEPHAARVDASDCVGCHKSVRSGPRQLRPPLPFDTTEALKQSSLRQTVPPLVEPGRSRGQGSAPPEDDPPGSRTESLVSPSDTFPHSRHSKLACLTCHELRSRKELTFEPPRGCQICHHQRPKQADCGACHQRSELEPTVPLQVAVEVPKHERRRRTVQFPHEVHDTLACISCHVTPVTMAPSDSALTCIGCHDQHHSQSRDCATCHRTGAIRTAHQRPIQAHIGCDGCHTPTTVARLEPTRSFCLACHQSQQDHYAPKECSVCHFQRTPRELEPQLRRQGRT